MRQIYIAGNLDVANNFSRKCEEKGREVYSIRRYPFCKVLGSGFIIEYELSMGDYFMEQGSKD